jgi:hypothetical protein
MKKAANRSLKDWLFENGSYKILALFVTLILWVTILGRRDFILSKEVDIEFLLPRSIAVVESGLSRRAVVKVSGPRVALKRFAQNPGTITIDLARNEPGRIRAVMTPQMVEVPFGVKVISVSPEVISVTLKRVSSDGDSGQLPSSPRTQGD